MRQQFFKFIALLLAIWLLALPAISAPEPSANKADIEAQEKLFQVKLDARNDKIEALNKRIEDQVSRVSDISASVDRFGWLITALLFIGGFLGYISVVGRTKREAEETAKEWFDQNTEALKIRLADLDNKITASLDRINKREKEVIDLMQETMGGNATISPELAIKIKSYTRELDAYAKKLEQQPEAHYSFDDWNTRAFSAYANNKFDEAALYWGKAANIPNSGAKNISMVMLNKAVALGKLEHYEEEEIKAYDAVIDQFGKVDDANIRTQVVRAMNNKGTALGQLGRYEESIKTYEALIEQFGNDSDATFRTVVGHAMSGKGFSVLCIAKREWSDALLRVERLRTAMGLFENANEHVVNSATNLGNRAYCAWLLGDAMDAENQFKLALSAPDGGDRIYKATIIDLDIAPIDLDAGFKALIDRLYADYQSTRQG